MLSFCIIYLNTIRSRFPQRENLVPVEFSLFSEKEIRDKIMEKYDHIFANYSFRKHKGYGTKLHYEELTKYKPSAIHRETFNLSKQLLLFE